MSETTPAGQFSIASLLWLVAWVATLAAITGGMRYARQRALADFSSAEAQAEWNEFRTAMKEAAEDEHAPVARRMPQSAEPPTLRLLRDHFAICLGLALLLSSLLFATLMFMVRGVLGAPAFQPHADPPLTGDGQRPGP